VQEVAKASLSRTTGNQNWDPRPSTRVPDRRLKTEESFVVKLKEGMIESIETLRKGIL
jgi:hypothetical protein